MGSQTATPLQLADSQSYTHPTPSRKELPYGAWPGLHESTLPEDNESEIIASPSQQPSSTTVGTKRKRALVNETLNLNGALNKQVLSDRQRAIRIIEDFAEAQGWGDERFDRALDLVHDATFVDIIVTLSQKRREAWLARKASW